MTVRFVPFALLAALSLSLGACTFESKKSNVKNRAIAPPSAEDRNKLAAIAAQPTVMDTFRALAPAEGLKYTRLFDDPLENPDERIKRIEDSIQALRNDFDTTVPTLVRMVAIEKDIKNLVAQLQSLVDPNAAAPPAEALPVQDVSEQVALPPPAPPPLPETAAVPAPAPAPALASAPVVAAKEEKKETPSPISLAAAKPEPKPEVIAKAEPPKPAGAIKDIRITDEEGKTRLVLDMTEDQKLTTKMQDEGLTLVIDLAGMEWQGKKKWEADEAALVSGYRVEGGKLYLDLMYVSEIRLQEFQDPEKSGKGRRLVIDLFSQDVHGTS